MPCFLPCKIYYLSTEWGDAGDLMSVTVLDYIFVRYFKVEKCKKGKQAYKTK